MPNEVVIRASREWELPDWRLILRYRDLLYILVRRELISKYIQTLLGPLWYIVHPVLTATLFAALFSQTARIPTEGIPPLLFYLTGLISWGYFCKCLETVARSLVNHAHLLQKVYFPRVLIPLSIVLSKVYTYLIQLLVLVIFIIYFHLTTDLSFKASSTLLCLPLLLVQTALLALGVGLWIAALTTRYRDVHHFFSFAIQFWMYATPIIYPISMIPENWRPLLMLNPMTSVVESYRLVLFSVGGVSFLVIAYSVFLTAIICFTGLLAFQHVEKRFIDTL